jgi:hypothetical protein
MDAHQPPIHPIIPPPAIYDHAYNGRLSMHEGTMAQVEYYCHTRQGIVSEYQALGCSIPEGRSCCSGRDARFIARPPHRTVRAAFPHTAPTSGA